MVSYCSKPQYRVVTTYGGTNYTFESDQFLMGRITRVENGFDTATLLMKNDKSCNYNVKVGSGSAITISFKDAREASWTVVFAGIVRFAIPRMTQDGFLLELKCDGAGYGLIETACNEEYGTEAKYGTGINDLRNILTDGSYGIIPKYVNKILGSATASGFNYTANATTVENIDDDIQFINFPYKPCMNAINDLCDIEQAIKGAAAGPHWIVDTNNNFLMCLLGASHPDADANGWYKYYGNSQENATIEQGEYLLEYSLQALQKEANFVVYAGEWKRPANSDYLTENHHELWTVDAGFVDGSNDTIQVVNKYCYYVQSAGGAVGFAWYPNARNLGWNLTKICSPKNVPSLNWYARKDANVNEATIILYQDATPKYWRYDFDGLMTNVDEWYHFSLPVGPYYDRQETQSAKWDSVGGPDWAHINAIEFYLGMAAGGDIYIDGLHFSGAKLIRIAKESAGYGTTNVLRARIITDNQGADDTLLSGTPGTTDIGLMARMAKAELYRCNSTPLVGYMKTPLIYGMLPGMFIHGHAEKTASGTYRVDKDLRVTSLTHEWTSPRELFTTTMSVTDDLVNSRPRLSPANPNSLIRNVVLEQHNRQTSSVKVGDLDPDIPVLEESY